MQHTQEQESAQQAVAVLRRNSNSQRTQRATHFSKSRNATPQPVAPIPAQESGPELGLVRTISIKHVHRQDDH